MSRAVPRYRRVNPNLPGLGAEALVMLTVKGLIEGQTTINTFYYLGSPAVPLTPANLALFCTNWQTGFSAPYRACLSSDWTLQSVNAQDLSQPTLSTVTDTSAAGVSGTGAAGHEPTTVAVVITRNTAVKGQHGRGRIYLPAVPTASVLQSSLTVAAASGVFATMATDLGAGFVSGGTSYFAAVAQRSKTPPRAVIGAAPVTGTQLHALLGTIRRRRVGRGK